MSDPRKDTNARPGAGSGAVAVNKRDSCDWDEAEEAGILDHFRRDARDARTMKDLRLTIESLIDCLRCAGLRVGHLKRERDGILRLGPPETATLAAPPAPAPAGEAGDALVAFFREEAPAWGARGDHEQWSPVETALHYLRAVHEGESRDAAEARQWRQFSALPLGEDARHELAQFAGLLDKIGALRQENARLRALASAAADARAREDAGRLYATPDRDAPCGGVHPVLYHAVMDAIERAVVACDTHERARVPREARAIDYAGILVASVEHAQARAARRAAGEAAP